MNYTLADLDKAIYFCLTLNKDKLVSYDDIYAELHNTGSCADLITHKQLGKKRFDSACETITYYYDDVYHLRLNMKDYLIFTRKSCQEIELLYGGKIHRTGRYETVSHAETTDTQQDELLINKNWLDKHNLFEQYDEVDTFIHAICRHSNVDLFEYVTSQYDIDFSVTNKNGQTVLDVIPNTLEGFEIMKKIAHHSLKHQIFLTNDLYNKINEIEILTSYKNYYKKENHKLVTSIDLFKYGFMLVGLLWFGNGFVF
jgi:hypothetical protein